MGKVRIRLRRRRSRVSQGSRKRYLAHREKARSIIAERLVRLNHQYGFSWKTVSIRNQRTRWGSCSKNGNLNFNYRLVFLPPHLIDYVVVHELCHLGEFNHSKSFWTLVEKTVPDWRTLRAELKRVRLH